MIKNVLRSAGLIAICFNVTAIQAQTIVLAQSDHRRTKIFRAIDEQETNMEEPFNKSDNRVEQPTTNQHVDQEKTVISRSGTAKDSKSSRPA